MPKETRNKRIADIKKYIKGLSYYVDSGEVFKLLSQVCSALVMLSNGESEGIKPLDAERLMYFIMRLVVRTNGFMESEGEDTDALRKNMKSLGMKVLIGPSAPTNTIDLDSKQILGDIAAYWDDIKDNVSTYYVLMYVTRYSRVGEYVVKKEDRDDLKDILRDLIHTENSNEQGEDICQ